ncbi:HAD domain-containing protein [Delftia tsuruhatensis]|uniref:HAD domain-containing protein n=1 Tax=Delftia tsuruhatensis TaxID=180282 RepID=UPI00289EFCED|nr:HAD domain-containing protein [Delftia tsuruhatensis]
MPLWECHSNFSSWPIPHVLVSAGTLPVGKQAMSTEQSTPYVPASRPRSADVVLYLDLDGVVHHEKVLWHPGKGIYMSPYEAAGHTLFEWLPILEQALEPYPALALVLSSTWCIRPGYSATLKRFPITLRSRFIGGTYHKRVHGVDPWNQAMFRKTPRGVQIQQDAQRRKPHHWIALDDDLEDWPAAYRHHLIACDGTTGLSDPGVQRELKEQLHRCHSTLPDSG